MKDKPTTEVRNPWQTLTSKPIYNNPWIELTEHQVINPSGNRGIYGVVHFHTRAVGVIPYENGHLWMVGQYRYPLDIFSWELPEGGAEIGESTLAAAQRELKEETGLTAQHYEPIIEMHLSNAVSDEWGVIYLATDLSHGEAEPEDCEELAVKKMTLEEVYAEVEAHRITDSLTVAAIYKLMLMKAQGKLPA